MPRSIFNILTGLSLFLLVVTSGVWVQSYLRADEFKWSHISSLQSSPISLSRFRWWGARNNGYEYVLTISRGGIMVDRKEEYIGQESFALSTSAPKDIVGQDGIWGSLGFDYSGRFSDLINPTAMGLANLIGQDDAFHLLLPAWFLCAILALAPARWYQLLRRRQKQFRSGQCRVCGYDLRASVDRCPECGTVILRQAGHDANMANVSSNQ